jgi:hypothetical protein
MNSTNCSAPSPRLLPPRNKTAPFCGLNGKGRFRVGCGRGLASSSRQTRAFSILVHLLPRQCGLLCVRGQDCLSGWNLDSISQQSRQLVIFLAWVGGPPLTSPGTWLPADQVKLHTAYPGHQPSRAHTEQLPPTLAPRIGTDSSRHCWCACCARLTRPASSFSHKHPTSRAAAHAAPTATQRATENYG